MNNDKTLGEMLKDHARTQADEPQDEAITLESALANSTILTVNILRLWDADRIRRFALHLLGDKWQAKANEIDGTNAELHQADLDDFKNDVARLESQLAAALAASHELGESLLVISEKYQTMAGEREGLALDVERLKEGTRQMMNCTGDMWVCAFAEVLYNGGSLDEAYKAAEKWADEDERRGSPTSLRLRLAELAAERDALNEKATEYRDLADQLETDVRCLTDN